MGGGGGDSGAADKSNALLQEQINIQKRQTAQQESALSEQQFNIVKSQGGLNWSAKPPTGIKNDI